MSVNTNTRAARVSLIGKGERLTSEVAAAIVAFVGESYVWTERGAVPAAIDAYVSADGEAPAKSKGPKGEQRLTDYGRGCDRLRKAVAALVKGEPDAKPAVLRVSLSGEGGGTAVVPADAPAEVRAYLLSLIAPAE